ncbi:hypothetical protein G6F57_004765 [Rhizopus arrhizus]|uniref:Uncharacterized protein n=1 Tax=Rhizopus oryzae TaxID=64495 RepID=A0A9P6XCM6_RHIOR|nr:hypothetical protein G6F23_003049 [Rhizopus arrhizus]KAG1421525.1 hypothetical protein G6F58_003723 [Rhizopus delemar]KAG0764409.1 hypothetical protein G6F24_005241 [Rhizopus arrhizus]KAG0796110.1 hypothetical protein G6F21_001580 [Rhizopus arrhizus]KAG0796548.1 hypothetical protein G6F22_004885 [Rhizopus arrhizus]
MSIEETLQNLIYNSKRIAAVTFADDDSPIVASVLSKKSKLIREADPLESAVHAVCFGDESIEYITSRLPNLSKKSNPKTQEVQDALQSLDRLNRICKDSSIQNTIKDYTGMIQEREDSLAHLYGQYSEDDTEVEALKERIKMEKNREVEKMQVITHDEELYHHLKQTLEVVEQRRKEIQKRKLDQKERLDKLRMEDRKNMDDSQAIETLQKKISIVKQKIKEYELRLESPSSQPTRAPVSTSDRFIQLNVTLNQLQSEDNSSISGHNANKEGLVQVLQNTANKLRDIIDDHNRVEATNQKTNMFIHVYEQLLQQSSATDNAATVKDDAIIQSAILKRLLKLKQEHLNELTEFIKSFAKENNHLDINHSAIYKLVATGLVVIDRSGNEPIVKLIE